MRTQTTLDRTALEALVSLAPSAALVTDSHGVVVLANQLAEHQFGFGPGELIGAHVDNLTVTDTSRHLALRRQFHQSPGARPMGHGRVLPARRRDGSEFPAEIGLTPVATAEGAFVMALVVDVSWRRNAEQALRESEERYGLIFESAADGIGVLQDGRFAIGNESLKRLLGGSMNGHTPDKPFEEYIAPHHRKLATRYSSVQGGEPLRGQRTEVQLMTAGGELGPWVEIHGSAIEFEGRPALLVVLRDVTERRQSEADAERLANHDSLTGLLNRRAVLTRLSNELASARRRKTWLAVLYLDLDGFKSINDLYGHAVGDALLAQIAQRFQGLIRATDVVGRLGGDEFVAIMTDVKTVRDVERFTQKLFRGVSEPFVVGAHRLEVGLSIGVGLYPADGESPEALLHCADTAMYRAKHVHGNTARFFSVA